jgi:formylglycine-generating enzyme required for sulfatase activity
VTLGARASFFSYSRDDSEFVLRLAGDLKAARASVWMDQLDIVPGQRWDSAVEDALANCPCMIVILSPASVNSTNVMDEVSFALEEKKTVIPVIHKDCTVPFRLRRLQHVDFRQDYGRGLKELLKTLAAEQEVGEGTPASSASRIQEQTDVTEPDEQRRLEQGRTKDDEVQEQAMAAATFVAPPQALPHPRENLTVLTEKPHLSSKTKGDVSRSLRAWIVLAGAALLVALGVTWFIKSQGSDLRIQEEIERQFHASPDSALNGIKVQVINGVATLEGTVPEVVDKTLAATIARDVSRKESLNKIEVKSPTPTTVPPSVGLNTKHEGGGTSGVAGRTEVQSPTPTTVPPSVGLNTKHEGGGVTSGVAGRTRVNSRDRLTYVWIEPGTFHMGCSPGDGDCGKDEMPAHSVTITRGFWMGQTAVTQAAYQRVKGSNPSSLKGDQRPVVEVNWYDAVAYCSAVGMRLPTEAEWEYAARAGSSASRYGDLDLVAWWGGNSGNQLHDVAQKQPNGWGLFDMLGNVWQWTADWYSEDYYNQSSSRDPKGPPSGTEKVTRGGAFHTRGDFVRASRRGHGRVGINHVSTVIGFRCSVEKLP